MSKSHVANKNIGCFQLYPPLLYPAISSRDISAAFASKISPILYNKKTFRCLSFKWGGGGGGIKTQYDFAVSEKFFCIFSKLMVKSNFSIN